MADGRAQGTRNSNPGGQGAPEPPEFRVELVDGLPGGRAIVWVEQEGCFMWLADRNHVSPQARDEWVEQMNRIIGERWWEQNWPGA